MPVDQPTQYVVDHAAQSYDDERSAVPHHFFPERHVELKAYLFYFLEKNQQGEQASAEIAQQVITQPQVFIVYMPEETIRVAGQYFRNNAQEKNNDGQVDHNTHHAGKSVSFGTVLLPQPGKRQGVQVVDRDDRDHPQHIIRVRLQVGPGNNQVFTKNECHTEQDAAVKQRERQGIIQFLFIVRLGETEISSFEAVRIYHVQERDDGIYLHEVGRFARHRNKEGKGHVHQVTQEAAGNGGYAVPECLSC